MNIAIVEDRGHSLNTGNGGGPMSAVLEAREARAARDSKALSCALCAGQHALISLEALLTHPSGLQPAEYTYLVRTADRLRAKLAEAERLEAS